MKVSIENYQSIKNAEIEVKGLTVVTGPNNTGKSACARAIANVFSNTRGISHVRKGEKSSKVSITFDDGNNVIWEKGKGINKYTVNGFEINKVGSKVPDEVKKLGVVPVEVDGREVYPQIARQFQQIFLLDLPPSVLSSALSDVDAIQTLEKASSLARNEHKSLKSKIKVKLEDLEKEKYNKTNFEGVEDLEYLIIHIEKYNDQCEELDKKIYSYENVLRKREDLMFKILNIKGTEKINIPKEDLQRFNQIEELTLIKRKRNKLRLMEGFIDVGLMSYPKYPDSKDIRDTSNLEKVDLKRKQLKDTINIISEADFDFPKVNQALIGDLKLSEERVVKNKEIESYLKEIESISAELREIKTCIGDTCPLCEQGITH